MAFLLEQRLREVVRERQKLDQENVVSEDLQHRESPVFPHRVRWRLLLEQPERPFPKLLRVEQPLETWRVLLLHSHAT